MRANMINMKIHVDGNQIRNAFLFKKDLDGYAEGYPYTIQEVMQTKVPEVKMEADIVAPKKKKKKMLKQPTLGAREEIQQMPNEGRLTTNEKLEHKVY